MKKLECTLTDIDNIKNNLFSPDFKIPENGKVIDVLWSGGLDSTFLMFWLIYKGYIINAYHIEIYNNNAKNIREREARTKILDVLYDSYPSIYNKINYFSTPKFSIEFPSNVESRVNNIQLSTFAQVILFSCNDIALGYVNGDDAIYDIDNLNNIAKTINSITKKTQSNKKEIYFQFPLIKIKKYWFYKAIPKNIFKHITWCEHSAKTQHANCNCIPCKRARYELKL